MDIRRQYSLYTLGIHRIPTDSLRCNLEAHQQLINRSKEQIVRQGWEPEGWQLVRFPKSRPFFETWGVPAPFQLLGHRRLDLCWHQIYLGRPSYCCCQPQLNWIKMRLSGGWRCSMKNYAVFWWNFHLKNFPEILPKPLSPASAILQSGSWVHDDMKGLQLWASVLLLIPRTIPLEKPLPGSRPQNVPTWDHNLDYGPNDLPLPTQGKARHLLGQPQKKRKTPCLTNKSRSNLHQITLLP